MDGLSVSAFARWKQEAFWDCVNGEVRRMVTALLEKTLQLEQQAHVAARWNERSDTRRGYRNGSYSRRLVTAQGPVQIAVPRCRAGGLDCSLIFNRYQRRITDVDRILRHAYLLGASTRGVAQLGEQVFGHTLSHQTVSRVMRWLDEQIRLWRQRPIAPAYKVVYVDGMHVEVLGQDRMVMLVCGQREIDAPLEVLDFCVSTGEQCRDLLADLRRRGLEEVALFVSDESGAIRSALAEVYPEVGWQSCTFHRLKALWERLGPTDFRRRMVREASNVFRCPSRGAAVEAAIAWGRRWRDQDPWAVQRFLEGIGDSLQFYSLPKEWWRRARTNNPLERLIRTLRTRLNPMGCFHDPPAVERAVFGQLLRWHKTKLTHNS